jgi:hypothetical protein
MSKFMGKNVKTPKAFRFTDEELALLEELSAGRTMNQTVVDGLKALKNQRANAPTDEELLDFLAARLKTKRAKR